MIPAIIKELMWSKVKANIIEPIEIKICAQTTARELIHYEFFTNKMIITFFISTRIRDQMMQTQNI